MEIVGRRRVGVICPTEYTEQKILVAVSVDVPHGRSVVTAGADRLLSGEGKGFTAQIRSGSGPGVFEVQDTGLEVVTPEEILVAVAVHVAQRHRVRAVETSDLSDDLDAFEAVRHQLEEGDALVVRAGLLVPRHRAFESTDEQVHAPVAIDVRGVGDVLTVREDGPTLGITDRIRRLYEACILACPIVPVVPHVAERALGQQVVIPVPVEVDEAVPLADFEILIAVRTPLEGSLGARDMLEEHHAPGGLLEKEVFVSVCVDVDELRTRDVEATEERLPDGAPRFVHHGYPRDVPVVPFTRGCRAEGAGRCRAGHRASHVRGDAPSACGAAADEGRERDHEDTADESARCPRAAGRPPLALAERPTHRAQRPMLRDGADMPAA